MNKSEFVAYALMVLALMLGIYISITNDLCENIESYSVHDKIEMRLDESTCALPWYKKL